MAFSGRKNNCEMDLTEEELNYEQNDSNGNRLHVQERTIPFFGLVSRQVEFNEQNQILRATRWAISQNNQTAGQRDNSNSDFDIKSWMKMQDNLPELEKNKYKHDNIKRWVISQEKYLQQRSNEMRPSMN
ncbi:uncharacterized protein LOC117580663 isoform X2 [Drosophila guanche]|uniref:uncharacterized protein LOC117580662 isoform X2 n=1 Tax=Drosophila guanche TaxID=7266 RepID=UPI001470A16B|nr:uncharacterized protein LOC117580662 isoform X2 [Drosophila guanche]XP_034123168.1 uncharacterized protein LOC117580663 isoform X2 [Drosophila guanche]